MRDPGQDRRAARAAAPLGGESLAAGAGSIVQQSRRIVNRGDDLVAAETVCNVLGGLGWSLADQFFDLGDGKDLALDQGVGQAIELVAVFFQDAIRALVGFAEDACRPLRR